MRWRSLGVVVCVCLFGGALFAQTPVPGPDAMGVGGAFVASGNDAASLWGNPAGIAACKLGCADLFAGGIASDENQFVSRLRSDFAGADFAGFAAGHNLSQIPKLVADLKSFQTPGTGAIGSGSGGLAYAVNGFAIGIGETVYAGAYPTIDLTNVTPATFLNNQTAVTLRGLEARELRLGYAFSALMNRLTIGVTTRYIEGRTFGLSEPILEAADTPVDIIRDSLKKNEEGTNRIAFDAGAIFSPIPKLRIGLVGMSLNEPKFAIHETDLAGNPVGSTEIPLPRVLRLGASFAPLSYDGIVFTADADLNKQKTLIPGLSSQRIGGGVQIYFFRVGAFRDLEAVDPHWAYTGGFRIGTRFISIDVAGTYSSGRRDEGAAATVRVKL